MRPSANGSRSRGIYVETTIRAPMDRLWHATQDPTEHVRWDLRFSEIAYLPRPSEAEPQRFLYATRLGLGVEIRGTGESTGTRDTDSGARTSGLRFSSDDARSLIREGSGYWKYEPTPDGIRFATWYDYRTRFGAAGRLMDRLFFRPLIAWATAWSFDRLRRWLERGDSPGQAAALFAIALLARVSLGVIWIYQGLVPKLIARHADEAALLSGTGFPAALLDRAMIGIGLAELLFGLVILMRPRWRWVFPASAVLMVPALLAVVAVDGRFLVAAFNPVSLNVAVVAIAVIGWIASADAPSAANAHWRIGGAEP
jgi:hypothetical protein